MANIVIVGSLNMDFVIYSDRMPKPGETIFCNEFRTFCGGKGANQAVMAARLGASATMIGCTGEDIYGDNLRRNLSDNGVDTSRLFRVRDQATGAAFISVVQGANTIMVSKGANFSLTPEHIRGCVDVIRRCDVVMLVNEIPFVTVCETIRLAHRLRRTVLYNPAPASRIPESLLPMVDMITPNESECETITGILPDTDEKAAEAVAWLVCRGVKTAMITLGSRGAILNDGKRIIRKKVPSVEVRDTTAAGDAFNATLAVFRADGEGIVEAVSYANASATRVVMKQGAQDSLPGREDVLNTWKEYRDIFREDTMIGVMEDDDVKIG